MEKKFTFKNIIFALYRRMWIIALFAVAGAIAGFCYSTYYITPTYNSKATFVVTSSSNSTEVGSSNNEDQYYISTGEQNSAAQLINTYERILTSRVVCTTISDYVKERNNIDYTPNQIKNMITITQLGNSQIMRLTITCKSYEDAYQIANAFYYCAEEQVHKYFKRGGITPLDAATLNTSRVAPSRTMYTFGLGVAFALIVAVIIIVVTLLDKRIKSEEDIVSICNIPIIGTISHANR